MWTDRLPWSLVCERRRNPGLMGPSFYGYDWVEQRVRGNSRIERYIVPPQNGPVPAGRHVKVKVKVTLEQDTKAQSGSRGIAYSFFNLGASWGRWSTPRLGRFTPGKGPVPIV